MPVRDEGSRQTIIRQLRPDGIWMARQQIGYAIAKMRGHGCPSIHRTGDILLIGVAVSQRDDNTG